MKASVRDMMTARVVAVGPGAPLAGAARLMRDRRVKRLPVTNATGHLTGVLRQADVLRVFARPDADIRREVAEEVLAETLVADSPWIGVTVQDGVVTLTGQPDTDAAGRELAGAVRHLDGVIAVRDQLSYAGQPR